MALPIRPNNPNIPIPNTTFTSPLNLYVSGPYFPVVMGTGVDINNENKVSTLNNDGVLDISGATGDINLLSGTGITVTESSGDFTISNDGVLQLIAGGNVTITGSNGIYTISASDAQTGTVTSVGTGVGLTGGPITTSGTISLDSSGVTPGSYTYPAITVDAYGRVTVAANGTTPVTAINGTAPVQVTGSAPTLTVSVAASSTTAPGVVQLNDSTSSTSTTQALTAAQGKVLQDQITALAIASNITLAGTLDASTGNLTTITAEGTSAGFAVGSPLPAAAAGNDNYFVIASVAAASYTPPGGSATVVHVGDWFLSDGSAWQFLDVGDSSGGTVTSVATTAALTGGPITTSGTLDLAATGVTASTYNYPTALTVDACGRITSLSSFSSAPVTHNDFQAKGDILAGTGIGAFTDLSVGTDGQILYACSGATTGLCWANPPATAPATPTVEGIVFGCTDSTNYNYGLGDGIFGALTTGTLNIAVGAGALATTDTGTSNTAIGIGSLYSNTSGTQNLALGQQALFSNLVGGLNTAIGSQALQNATGDANTALGNFAGNILTTGCSNILIGNQAGGAGAGALDTGSNNVVIGNCVSVADNTGDCQLAVGVNTLCWLTGDSTGAIKPGAGIIDCAGSCGTAGQVLSSDGSNAIEWVAAPSPAQATPTTLGTLYGTISGLANSGFGQCALVSNTGTFNTAAGIQASWCNTTGSRNASFGMGALSANTTGNLNTALGQAALVNGDPNCGSTAVGYKALGNLLSGSTNSVALGICAGMTQLSGDQNVFIGPNVKAPITNGSCQLVIGFDFNQCWLTGDSTKAIKPGAGIIDCAGSCGTAGQVLMSNGSNAICWGTVSGGAGTVTSITAGTGLTGGTITSSGTVALDTACVIQPSALTAKGDLITATAASTPTALSAGTDGQVLYACSTCASGLVWATPQTSPFITYTTSAVSYTSGTPLLVAKWYDGTIQGTVTLDLSGYGGINQLWDFYLSGQSTNYNTGWYQTASFPASSSDPLSQGTWYVDFPVYPSPDANAWMIYFSPSQNSLNPSTFTFFYRPIAGSSISWQI